MSKKIQDRYVENWRLTSLPLGSGWKACRPAARKRRVQREGRRYGLPWEHKKCRPFGTATGCQKRSHHAAFSDILRTGDEDAKERSGTATSGRNVVHRYVGTQRTLAAEDRRCGKFRTYLRIGRRLIL